jgi:hypothetical protein
MGSSGIAARASLLGQEENVVNAVLSKIGVFPMQKK